MNRKEGVARLMRGEMTAEERRDFLASVESAPLTDDELGALPGVVRLLDEGDYPAETIIAYLQGDAHPADQEAIESLIEDDPVFRDRVQEMRVAFESANRAHLAEVCEPAATARPEIDTRKTPSWLKLTSWMAPTLAVAAATYIFVLAPRTQTNGPVVAQNTDQRPAPNTPNPTDTVPSPNNSGAPNLAPPTPTVPGPGTSRPTTPRPTTPSVGQQPRPSVPSQGRPNWPSNLPQGERPTIPTPQEPTRPNPEPEPERSYYAQLAENGVPQEPSVRPREASPAQYAGGGFTRVSPDGLHIQGQNVVLGWPMGDSVDDFVATLEVNGVPVMLLNEAGEPQREVRTGARPGWKVVTEQPLVPGVAYEWRVRAIMTDGGETEFGGWFTLLTEEQRQTLSDRLSVAENDVERALAYYAFGVYDKSDFHMGLALQSNNDPDVRRLAARMQGSHP